MPRNPDWLTVVNEPPTEAELARMRLSVQRGQPFGNEDWTEQTAKALGLQFTLRSGGRPRGNKNAVPPDGPRTGPGLFGYGTCDVPVFTGIRPPRPLPSEPN